MKKTVIISMLIILPVFSFSQVFNAAQTLKKGTFSLGVNPVVWEDQFNLFLHAGYGLKSGVDLAFKYGMLEGDDYVGANIEWSLRGASPYISLTTGAHVINDMGLDMGLNLSFPVRGDTQIYSGLDTDIIFGNDINTFIWLPIGVDLALKKKMSMILEAEVPLTDASFTIFGGGLAFYF